MSRVPRIAVTPGEPAGIGPDIIAALLGEDRPAELVLIADPHLLAERARSLGLTLELDTFDARRPPTPGATCLPVALNAPAKPGTLNKANAPYVLATLEAAARGCLDGRFDALFTGPVHKGVINEAGIAFTGHTEFLAELSACPQPVMMLTAGDLRVALLTTHLPLEAVSRAISDERLKRVIRILHRDLHRRFAIQHPRILVCGLNPHAGEGGHLGREEIEIIEPALAALREEGLDLTGPLPADTAFTPRHLKNIDAVLAMYHDQGLPVLKYAGFGRAVNITLGLPFIRTSVDHGTALELAGTGAADPGSAREALQQAIDLSIRRQVPHHPDGL